MHYHFIELVYASLRLDNPSDTMKNEYIYYIHIINSLCSTTLLFKEHI